MKFHQIARTLGLAKSIGLVLYVCRGCSRTHRHPSGDATQLQWLMFAPMGCNENPKRSQ